MSDPKVSAVSNMVLGLVWLGLFPCRTLGCKDYEKYKEHALGCLDGVWHMCVNVYLIFLIVVQCFKRD